MNPDTHELLVQTIYAGVLVPSEWDKALAKLSEVLGFSQGCILLGETVQGGTSVVRSYNIDPAFTQQYEETYSVIDPGKRFVAGMAPGTWYFDDRHLSPDFKRSNAFYQEFMAPYGFTSNICAALYCNESGMAGLSFQSEQRTYCFDGTLPQRQLSSLVSHFRKAVELRFAFDKLSRKALLGQKLADRISAPVLIVNRQAEVLYANASGEAWLANSGSSATKEPAGFFRKPLVLEAVKQLFAQSHAVAISSPPNGTDGCASVLVGLPITRALPLGQHADEPLGMLVVHERGRGHTNGAAIFGQLYGLTRAEQRLLVTWASHGSVRAAAEKLNVSVETVRTQIKSVLAKTGCDRQIDLANLVSQLGLLM